MKTEIDENLVMVFKPESKEEQILLELWLFRWQQEEVDIACSFNLYEEDDTRKK